MNDKDTAKQADELFEQTHTLLEERDWPTRRPWRRSRQAHPTAGYLLPAASYLGLIERFMVWLYPAEIACSRSEAIRSRLRSLKLDDANQLEQRMATFCAKDNEARLKGDESALSQLRGLMDAAVALYDKHVSDERTTVGLQVERLKGLRRWGLIVLLVLVGAVGVLGNRSEVQRWTGAFLANLKPWQGALLTAGGIAAVGAAGGFLSGLMHARRVRAEIVEYLESLLNLYLRPIVGAVVSLVAYILLSWGSIPGFGVENPGAYVLVAFLSGFSERYFLRLLKVEEDNTT